MPGLSPELTVFIVVKKRKNKYNRVDPDRQWNEVFILKKIALLLALALVLGCACASADTARDDRGEEVRFLQWLLQKTGWLNDKADGVFGPRTEQAVRDYQNSRGYEETGVADEALLREIDRERTLRDKQANGQDYYEPYPGNYAPTWAADYAAP